MNAGVTKNIAPEPLSFAEALRYWLKLGFISFGGPAGQIAMMHAELVEKRRWISERRFLHALNYCMVLPGPEAQQLATYIGWLMHGTRGGIAAGVLFVLPSLLILIALSWAYVALGAQSSSDLLYGIKPAVVAIVLFAAYRIGSKVLKQPLLWTVAAAAFCAVTFVSLPFPLIVAGAAALGWVYRKQLNAASGHAGPAKVSALSALLDDATPTPEHACYRRSRLIGYLLVGLGLWALSLLALLLWFGPNAVLSQMALFFSKAALVTFGGAYAVMPYVFQSAVQTYGWLTPAQMMDGLALGETTPGPLIIVVAFIGFVGAWTAQSGIATAVAGACVATFFTFLPSFLFILIGGPLVERTRDDLRLEGPLSCITAAVVGAIVYLAVVLAGHVLWPLGFSELPDVFALLLTLAALGVLIKNRLGMIPVIALCGAIGLGYRLMVG